MKKIFASVCLIVMCATMVSCGVDDKKVQNCISLRLNYEQAVREWNRLDSDTRSDVRDQALSNVYSARKAYLTEFSALSNDERTAYKELETECKKADENYLDSVYEDTTNVENNPVREIRTIDTILIE